MASSATAPPAKRLRAASVTVTPDAAVVFPSRRTLPQVMEDVRFIDTCLGGIRTEHLRSAARKDFTEWQWLAIEQLRASAGGPTTASQSVPPVPLKKEIYDSVLFPWVY